MAKIQIKSEELTPFGGIFSIMEQFDSKLSSVIDSTLIKSEELTPFGGIFSIMEQFDSKLSSVIDSTLGMRCKLYGYQYSEIIRSLMSVYFCGGSFIEDVTTHLMYHLSLYPTLRTCSADTILRAIKELTQDNISYTSDTGKTYDFNTLPVVHRAAERGRGV